jgi:hypothetical protein
MEQHAGKESEVSPGDPVEPMQFLSQSNWSPFIAPYRSVLIDRDSGLSVSLSAQQTGTYGQMG